MNERAVPIEAAGIPSGRLRKAPEHFLSPQQIADVARGRRDVLKAGFAAALAGMATGIGGAQAQTAKGESAILELPSWSTTLGMPVLSLIHI